MTLYLTVISGNDLVLRLVGDFARGLGCAVDMVTTSAGLGSRIEVPDLGHSLVELLTHVALSATKAGVDVTEPLCQLQYRHAGVSSEVTLTLRVAEFSIDTPATLGV